MPLCYGKEYQREMYSDIEDFLPSQIELNADEINESMQSINSVRGHNEQDTIIGNFTGSSLDTLYVLKIVGQNEDRYQSTEFFLKSTNSKIPSIELYGCADEPPMLVYEGDLDGNGTAEVGYLHTWINSQWRYYRIFTLVNNEWRYLIDGNYLDTPQWFRNSGVEIVEPGKEKGTILVHYSFEGYDADKDELVQEIRDTIVRPTFSIIKD